MKKKDCVYVKLSQINEFLQPGGQILINRKWADLLGLTVAEQGDKMEAPDTSTLQIHVEE